MLGAWSSFLAVFVFVGAADGEFARSAAAVP